MIGLGFLLALIFYIVIAVFVTRFLAHEFTKAKAVFFILTPLVFLAIPMWDVVPGRLYFNHLCETEGGLKIYKTVEGVEGLYQVEGGSGVAQSTLQYGYVFVEGTSLGGDLVRYTLGSGGQLIQQRISKPTSNYIVSRATEQRPFNISKTSYRIADVRTGEEYAVMNSISHAGNWLQVKFSPLLGHGGDCPLPSLPFKDFYTNTIKPKH